jgi:hypothetical protein
MQLFFSDESSPGVLLAACAHAFGRGAKRVPLLQLDIVVCGRDGPVLSIGPRSGLLEKNGVPVVIYLDCFKVPSTLQVDLKIALGPTFCKKAIHAGITAWITHIPAPKASPPLKTSKTHSSPLLTSKDFLKQSSCPARIITAHTVATRRCLW